ncbi:MAG: transposase [Planctomycetota bacterium]
MRQNGRKSIWVFGIVDPAAGWSMVSPHCEANTATMEQFLNAAAKKLGTRQHAVMVLDRAGWHTAKHLTWPRRITPLFLPPYSPALRFPGWPTTA